MAQPGAPRQRGQPSTIAQHTEAVLDAAKRLNLHAATFGQRSEAGQNLDRRIINEEAQVIVSRVLAILTCMQE